MIIVRSPLRISIGGGGTDLPSYYENNNGTTFSSLAINKYIYISLNKRFIENLLFRYLENEEVTNISDIKHPIIRETILDIKEDINSIEITSTSDVPSGTGLGSSGTFGVGLQLILRKYLNKNFDKYTLAKESTKIEKDILKRPIGLQDQYIAAFGGLTEFKVDKYGSVLASKNIISEDTKNVIDEKLLLFFADSSRDSSSVLEQESNQMKKKSKQKEYSDIVEMGKAMYLNLIKSNIKEYGNLMHDYWMIKRERQKDFTLKKINTVYDSLYDKNLIHGGKLVGAGGSGFLLLATKDPSKVKSRMSDYGMRELEFSIDEKGATLLEY